MKFKKGDKVNVYGWVRNSSPRSVDSLGPYCRGFRAKVIEQYADDEVLVKFTDGEIIEVHPNQCRKVTKKKKTEPKNWDLAIANILENFDFDRVERAMWALRWTWVTTENGGVPTNGELLDAARQHLEEIVRTGNTAKPEDFPLHVGSGGFRAWHFGERLELEFIVSDWDADINGRCG